MTAIRGGDPRRPVGRPVAWSNPETSSQVRGVSAPTGATTPTRSTAPLPEPEHRVSRRQLELICRELSDRDRAILQTVAAHRFITTRQLQALHFDGHASPLSSARRCRRVLERLHRQRLLGTLQRRVGGVRAGSAAYVWHLDVVGDRLLRAGSASGRSRQRGYEPSLQFLRHTLAVVDAHLSLHRLTPDVGLLRVETEPTCHRRYPGLGGGVRVLKPDLFAVTLTKDFEDSWFLEVDLGTESLPRLLAKCRDYEQYRRSGIEQERRDVFPLVVWLISDGHRRDSLLAAIDRDAELRTDLFRVITAEQLPALVGGDGQ